jgi:ABC-type lipoprotein export system ATPase subunit
MVLLVTHEREVAQYARHILLMKDGEIIKNAVIAEITT